MPIVPPGGDADKHRDQFAMVPALWFSLLTHRQFKIGAAILLHWNPQKPAECYPSMETLSKITGIAVRDVREDVQELERRGAVEILRTPGKVNHYRPRSVAHPGPERTGVSVAHPTPGSVTPPTPGCVAPPLTDQETDQKTNQVARELKTAQKTGHVTIVSRGEDHDFGTFEADVTELIAIGVNGRPLSEERVASSRRRLANLRRDLGDPAFERGLKVAIGKRMGVDYAAGVMKKIGPERKMRRLDGDDPPARHSPSGWIVSVADATQLEALESLAQESFGEIPLVLKAAGKTRELRVSGQPWIYGELSRIVGRGNVQERP